MMKRIRKPAVAGSFYPSDPGVLRTTVDTLLAEAKGWHGAAPLALVAPHAGYVYSGPVAASAYACLKPFRERYRRVVLLGPAHRAAVRGIALPDVDAFASPLGDVALDRETMDALDGPAMVRLAVAGRDKLDVDPVELDRGGISYTVETLRSIRAREDPRLPVFAIGLDSLAELPGWHEARTLVEGFDLVVVIGGDGTVGEAVSGQARADTKVPIAIAPEPT